MVYEASRVPISRGLLAPIYRVYFWAASCQNPPCPLTYIGARILRPDHRCGDSDLRKLSGLRLPQRAVVADALLVARDAVGVE